MDQNTQIFKYFVASLVFLVAPLANSDSSNKSLFSNQIRVVENATDRIVLEWNVDPETVDPHQVMLFIHGPVSDSTYTVNSFEWNLFHQETIIDSGDETDFSETNQWRKPVVQLKEIGMLAGCRIASLQLQHRSHYYSASIQDASYMVFPKGKIEIQFKTIDSEPFRGFPIDLEEIAKQSMLNYPPLRESQPQPVDLKFPPYFQYESIKCLTKDSGIVALDAAEILTRFNRECSIDRLALYRGDHPVPFIVRNSSGELKSGSNLAGDDRLEFFLPPSASAFSSMQAVWIVLDDESRQQPLSLVNNTIQIDPVDAIDHRIHLEENFVIDDSKDKNENQLPHWMWHDFIEQATFTCPLYAPKPVRDSTAAIELRFTTEEAYIHFATDSLYLALNETIIPSQIQRTQTGIYCATAEFQAGAVQPGTNTITVNTNIKEQYSRLESGVYLDWIELSLACHPEPAPAPYRVSSATSPILVPPETHSLWAVSREKDPEPVYYQHHPMPAAVHLPVATAELDLYLLPSAPKVAGATFSEHKTPLTHHELLRNQSQADIIVILPGDWIPTFQRYKTILSNKGYRCRLAPVEEIYDVFGDGRMSPFAIKQFIRYAYQHWESPRPAYVWLIGDATWDYWGFLRNNVSNIVPAYREEARYAVESWFVLCDNPVDPVPDMMIARWPIRSAEELGILIEKNIQYQQNPELDDWWNRLFILTDDEFSQYTDMLVRDWIPKGFRMIRRHIADYPLIDNIYLPERLRINLRAKTSLEATADILSILDQGVFLWIFFGHGAPNVLGEERMFFGGGSKFSDVKKLKNGGKLPMVWAYTCETAMFDYARNKWNISIGEDLLTYPDGGAIALIGATGRGYPTDHALLAKGMHEAAFVRQFRTLGQIFYAGILYGIANSNYFEPRKQFAILGDPTLVFPRFHPVEGSIELADSRLHYQWSLPKADNHSSNWSVWLNQPKEIMELQNHRTDSPNGRIDGLHPIQSISNNNARNGESQIGIDHIVAVDGAIHIYHGSIPIPAPEPAGEIITPTTGCLPDLQFVERSITFTPESPRSGETIFINAKVANQGVATATDVNVEGYYQSTTDKREPMRVTVGTQGARIERIDPGETHEISVRWDPTDNDGPHQIELEIDPYKRVQEENEDNNLISDRIVVRKKADLVIDATHVIVTPIEEGRRLQVYFEVWNHGESVAEHAVIELRMKKPGVDDLDLIRIPKKVNVEVGKSYSAGGIRIPSSIEYLEIIVDPDEMVDEESHENNKYRYVPG